MTEKNKISPALEAMAPEARRQFCKQVLEGLSDLVDGEAPEDFCTRVDEILGDCRSYLAFRKTFETTIDLTRELAAVRPRFEEAVYDRCLSKVRRKLG